MSLSAKRVYTQEIRDATRLSPSKPASAMLLSDELANALQNVGARVRKNVAEGYTTSRFTTPNVSPNRPAPAPAAPNSSPIGPIPAPIFRSGADTLHLVYASTSTSANSSPNRDPRGSSPPGPSRRSKRRLLEDDDDDDDEDGGSNEPETAFVPIPRPNFGLAGAPFEVGFGLGEAGAVDDEDMDMVMDVDMDAPAPALPPVHPSPVREIRQLKRRPVPRAGAASKIPLPVHVSGRSNGQREREREGWRTTDISRYANLPPD